MRIAGATHVCVRSAGMHTLELAYGPDPLEGSFGGAG